MASDELKELTREELLTSVVSLSDTNKQQEQKIKELTAQVAYLKRQLFGRKSEKHLPFNPNQLELFADQYAELFQQAEEKRDAAVEKIEKDTPAERKRKRENRKMIEDLPVLEREVIKPKDIDEALYKKIGEEITKVVKFKPGQLYIKEIIREKYALKDNTMLPPLGHTAVEIAPLPLLPINKCMADASLLSEILIQKYEYHMPYYRQIKQFTHLGMKGLKENTVDGWFKQTMNLLRPLYEALKREVMSGSDYNQADETTIPVPDKEKHKAAKEYLWMVRAVMRRLVFFHYDDGSRGGAVIESLARKYNFKGYLQCDGYAGYESAFKTNASVCLVGCMVHIRRKFEQALSENKEAAQHFLTEIQHLYKIEHLCDDAGLSFDERKAKRQELAKPIMDALRAWMETEGVKYGESTLIGKAVTYAYTRWPNMMNYLKDGRILLDNNLAENEIRPITLGRKNYLFCGNHEAAENMAIINSLLATCRNHDVNPRDYLNDVIAQMPYHEKETHEQLVELLPHRWKEKHPESIMTKLRDEV